MKRLAFFLLLSLYFLQNTTTAKTVSIDLSDAINNKSVRMSAVNFKGAYVGKTTRLHITNLSENTLQVKVNLGVILAPENPYMQPMVLAGEEMLVVQPSKDGDVDVNTFCGNAPFSCPGTGSNYYFSRVGSDTLVKVLRFIKTNSLFDYLGQDAVWVITNGNYVGGVYDRDREVLSRQFQDLICKLTGRNKADYYTVNTHVEIPAQPAYVPKPLKIIANFEILLDEPKTLTLGVFDSAGKTIQSVFENQTFPHAGHRFGVEFESADVTSGKYYIMLKEGEKVLQQKMVKVN